MSKDIFVDFPRELQVGTSSNASVYVRLPGFYAVHGWRADTPGPKPVQTLEEGDIAIMQGEPDPAAVTAARDTLSPVYSPQSGGAARSMAVPTGRVFIRFADGVKVGDRETEIRKAGYAVDQKLDYAPNAAWLSARSGSIADALNGISALQKIGDVENVEPQMLLEASRR